MASSGVADRSIGWSIAAPFLGTKFCMHTGGLSEGALNTDNVGSCLSEVGGGIMPFAFCRKGVEELHCDDGQWKV